MTRGATVDRLSGQHPDRRRSTMPPIISSLLDTDLYKFTMWQAMLHRHPQTQARYEFVCWKYPDWPLTLIKSRKVLPPWTMASARMSRMACASFS